MSLKVFAEVIGVPNFQLQKLLDGQEAITIDLARRITNALGGSIEFWMERDCQYRADVHWLNADEWVQDMPTGDMSSFGWIDRPADWRERIDKCLDFFNVSDVDSWQTVYGSLLQSAKFRSSESMQSNPHAVSAWLRMAEIDAEQLECAPWDRRALESCLAEARRLTRQRDPSVFIPKLRAMFASAGVVVGVIRAPRGCRASGAARALSSDKMQIVLSARYLSDDHLWFTLFHEAGHLLLHDLSSVYVDELEKERPRSKSATEREADDFAENMLVPSTIRAELGQRRPTSRELVRAGQKIGIAPGILVGQLQHAGVLSFRTRLNRLKRRYKWVDTRLEKV